MSRNTTEIHSGKWRRVRLGDVCREDRRIVEARSERAKQLRYLGLEHIESGTGHILREPGEAVGNEGSSTTFAFDERHVLYGKLRPYLNKVALPDFSGRCTTELIPLLPADELAREYLAVLLRRDETVATAMSGKTGSRMPRADMETLRKMEIPLPPLDEQRRIAARLREQLAAVSQARAALEAQLAAADALPAAHLRAVFQSPEAQRWPRARLGDALVPRNDILHPRNNPKGRARFVGLKHVERNTGQRIGADEIEKSELTGRKAQFFSGDIVYGYLRPYLNKVWIADFDGLCSVDQYVYRVSAKIADTGFIAWFMRSPSYLQRAPIGLTPGQLPRIRMEEVAAVEIELPPPAGQRAVAARLDAEFSAATALRAALAAKLSEVEKLPAALLRAAFAGTKEGVIQTGAIHKGQRPGYKPAQGRARNERRPGVHR